MAIGKTDGNRKEAMGPCKNYRVSIFMAGPITKIKVGDVLLMPVLKGVLKDTEVKAKCYVTDVYPHFVKARYTSDMGNVVETTFNYGALVMAGYERSGIEK